LEGGGSFEIGGAVENCGAGDLVIVPAGMPVIEGIDISQSAGY